MPGTSELERPSTPRVSQGCRPRWAYRGKVQAPWEGVGEDRGGFVRPIGRWVEESWQHRTARLEEVVYESIGRCWASEIEKRTYLLRRIDVGACGLIIDADETLHSNGGRLDDFLDGLPLTLPMARIELRDLANGNVARPRLLRHGSYLYERNHYTCLDSAGINVFELPSRTVESHFIVNAPTDRRSSARLDARRTYYRDLKSYEEP